MQWSVKVAMTSRHNGALLSDRRISAMEHAQSKPTRLEGKSSIRWRYTGSKGNSAKPATLQGRSRRTPKSHSLISEKLLKGCFSHSGKWKKIKTCYLHIQSTATFLKSSIKSYMCVQWCTLTTEKKLVRKCNFFVLLFIFISFFIVGRKYIKLASDA